MRKRILRVGAFLALLLVLLQTAGLLFQPKNNDYYAGMRELSANGILGEPDNTIDAVFLGDSEAYCAFIPLEIWEKTGIPSYVCGVVDQHFYQTPEYLRRCFQAQNPKVVVLETNVLYRGYPGKGMISYLGELMFPVTRYHDRWKKLRGSDWFRLPEYTEVTPEKGYHHSLEAVPADTEEYMLPTEDREPVSAMNRGILRYMDAYCRKRGARLVLVSSPSTQNWDYRRHNEVAAIAEALGLTYVDMNCLPEQIPIDWNTDTLDAGDHMNYYGASKVSTYMADLLADTGLFTDKRTLPEYAAWNAFAEEFAAGLPKTGP